MTKESVTDESLSKPIIKPKIDFSRTMKTGQVKKLQFSEHLGFEPNKDVVEFLEFVYADVSAILGLVILDSYEFAISSLSKKNRKAYSPAILDIDSDNFSEGTLKIDTTTFQTLCRWPVLMSTREVDEYDLQFFVEEHLLRVAGFIAHELYHKRQALLFPVFAAHRLRNYVQPEKDYNLYYNQLLEVGARLFSEKYSQHLKQMMSQSNDIPFSKNYQSE